MRPTIIVLLLELFVARTALAATEPAPPSWARTRPTSRGAIALLANAAQRSSIITSLLGVLERSDLVVYVADSMPGAEGGSAASHLVFLSLDSTTRYVLIQVDRFRLSPIESIVALGHELRHAVEVAEAREVRDTTTLVQLYRRIGREGQKNRFETEAARDTGNRVRRELAHRQAAPPPQRISANAAAESAAAFTGVGPTSR
ncbi:MAG: hypothetical protein ABI565_12230 [Vicinamibacteria bacterium]